ncbi:MAG: hypothetical protein ABJN84_02255 [Flavobacteriaceae bacterium]
MLSRSHIKIYLFTLQTLLFTALLGPYLAEVFQDYNTNISPNKPETNTVGFWNFELGLNRPDSYFPKQKPEQYKDYIQGKQTGELFGSSIALNSMGNRMAIGAPMSNINGKKTGQVRIYESNLGKWTQLCTIEGKQDGEMFGSRLALNAKGSKIAIGAPTSTSNDKQSGNVRVFELASDGKLHQLGETIYGKDSQEFFGGALTLNATGTRIAIGAPFSNVFGKYEGRVSAYELQHKKWVQLGIDIKNDEVSTEAQLGSSVSFNSDGSRLAIGIPFCNESNRNAGQVKVMEWVNSEWVRLGNPINGSDKNDMLGSSVSLSPDGSRLAVLTTPMGEGSGKKKPGKVQVFEFQNMEWKTFGTPIHGNLTGSSVAFGNNGNTLVIGMPFGVNPEKKQKSGKTQVYFLDDDVWTLHSTYYGRTNGELYGTALGVSGNAKSLAIGAPFNDEKGEQSGQVHIITIEE